MSNNRFLFILFFIVGFLYRIYLGSFSETKLIWDMGEYSAMAIEILQHQITANCCTHGPGYPLFLSLIYALFGAENIVAVRISQALIDLVTVWLVYKIACQVFNKKTAIYSALIYLINPFTSAYTGLVLTETISIFYVAFIAFVITRPQFQKRTREWFLLGIFLSLLAITKISFFFYLITFMLIIFFTKSARLIKKISFLLAMIVGFLLIAFYPILANYLTYHRLSIIPPYRTLGTLLYGSFYINFYPELTSEFYQLDPTYAKITEEYYFQYVPNPRQYQDYEKKYLSLFWQKLKTDWLSFTKNTLRNTVFIWDKRYLYTYKDPFYPADTVFLRIITVATLVIFSLGFFRFLKKKIANFTNPLILFTVSLGLYICLILAMVSNESRLSLPFYPLLYIWAGAGLETLVSSLFRFLKPIILDKIELMNL